jgi:hypothetical protein
MKWLAIAVASLFLLSGAVFAQKTLSVVGQERFEADFPSGGHLRMHVRSGELHIMGSDDQKISVRFWGKTESELRDVRVSLKTVGNSGDLSIQGGPSNNFEIEIRVPRVSNLFLRMPAGEAEIEGLLGDKDVELHAGDLKLEVGQPEQYAIADASVLAGDIQTGPFGVSKDGLFRSFHAHGSGKYRLHAHVGAGDITFE